MRSADVLTVLETAGVGVKLTTLFLNELPSAPVKALAAREYNAGNNGERVLGHAGQRIEYPRAQITARGATNDEAEAFIRAAVAACAAVLNQTVDGTYYLAMEPVGTPFYLKLDSNRNPIWAANIELQRGA